MYTNTDTTWEWSALFAFGRIILVMGGCGHITRASTETTDGCQNAVLGKKSLPAEMRVLTG